MTAPKSTLRQRRRTTVENLPHDLAAWFAGEPRQPEQSRIPWAALMYPDYALLPGRWQIWKAAHPSARPPAGFEWIEDPPPLTRHGIPYAEFVAQAERIARRGK